MGVNESVDKEVAALRKELESVSVENRELKARLDRLEALVGEEKSFGTIFPEVDMSRQLKRYAPASRINQNISGNAPAMLDADTRETWFYTSDSNANSDNFEQDISSPEYRAPLGEIKEITLVRNLYWSPIGIEAVPEEFQREGILVAEFYKCYVRDGHWYAKIGSYWDIIFEAVRCTAE